jgi:hypothetical protein
VQKLLTCGYLSDQGARALYAELAQQTHGTVTLYFPRGPHFGYSPCPTTLRPRAGAGDAIDRHFDNFYSAINVELRSLDLKLSRVKYPHDKQVYMGIVNTVRTRGAFSPSAPSACR